MSWNKNWDKIFKKYSWGNYPSEDLVRFTATNFKNKNNKKVLEIGCGTGANLWYFSREKFQTYGIDGSKVALKIAKRKLLKESLNVKLIHGDVSKIPFKNNYFDLIVDVECLYSNNLSDTKNILNEVKRVLKPNGFFYSQSFSNKTWGFKNGEQYKSEKLTMKNTRKGALKKENGIVRYLDLKTIKKIYGIFEIYNIEKSSRTINFMKNLIEEWIIICRKI